MAPKRTFDEWLDDKKHEEVELLLASAERIKWQMESDIERLQRDGVNADLCNGFVTGLVDMAGYERQRQRLAILQETTRRLTRA